MRKWLGISMVSVLVAAAGAVVRADDASPKAIIERAVKAQGGEDKLARFNAYTYTEKGKYYGMGDGIDYVGKYAVQLPDQFKMEHRAKDEQANAEVDQEAILSDYKDFDGTKMPTKVVVKRDCKLFVEAEVQDLKPAEKLDKSTFAKPQG